jgi:hypothetical protein
MMMAANANHKTLTAGRLLWHNPELLQTKPEVFGNLIQPPKSLNLTGNQPLPISCSSCFFTHHLCNLRMMERASARPTEGYS